MWPNNINRQLQNRLADDAELECDQGNHRVRKCPCTLVSLAKTKELGGKR